MTINIPIETYKRLLEAKKVLETIIMNARMIPDPAMNCTTDTYSIPLDDIESARKIVSELRGRSNTSRMACRR